MTRTDVNPARARSNGTPPSPMESAHPRPRAPGGRPGTPPGVPQPPGYLALFDLYRVVVCACVIAQHSFLWTGMSTNVVGTGFITMLHFTRNAFFLLSGLVVCYAQITRPRTTGGFWVRRYGQIGAPYLVWTLIYVFYTVLSPGGQWGQFGFQYWFDLRYGFYQLYVVVALLQFYLFFPLLLKLLRSTRRHWLIMGVSFALAMFIGWVIQYGHHVAGISLAFNHINRYWPWGRNVLSYQMFFIAGALAAFHLDRMLAFAARHFRAIMLVTGAGGVGTLLWYVSAYLVSPNLGSASDPFAPNALVWSLVASAGLATLSVRWQQRRAGVGSAMESAVPPAAWAFATAPQASSATGAAGSPWWRRIRRPTMASLAALTPGVFFSHVLFLYLLRPVLFSSTVGVNQLPWPITVLVLYLGTVIVAVAFVALVLRTPLRFALTGPLRDEQRSRVNRIVGASAAVGADSALPTVPARSLDSRATA